MSESSCASCGVRAETQWRIDLEKRTESLTERVQYDLCRDCWDDMCERFAESAPQNR